MFVSPKSALIGHPGQWHPFEVTMHPLLPPKQNINSFFFFAQSAYVGQVGQRQRPALSFSRCFLSIPLNMA
jgi:hypothetical protein